MDTEIRSGAEALDLDDPPLPAETHTTLDPVGVAMCVLGIAALIVALFLPYVSPPARFPVVVDNQLVQHDGWLFLIPAAAAAFALLVTYRLGVSNVARAWTVLAGLVATGLAVYMLFDKDSRTLGSALPERGDDLFESLRALADTAVGNPGAGMYAALGGGVLLVLGGLFMTRGGSR